MLTKRNRDSQRGKLYKAEQKHPLWNEAKMESFEAVQEYAKFVIDRVRDANVSLALQNGWMAKYPEVKQRKGTGRALARPSGSINMPKWTWTRMLVIHELAHLVAGCLHSHHAEFCRVYISMVQYAIGKDESQQLMNCFDNGRVHYLYNIETQKQQWKTAASKQPKLKPRERFLNIKLAELESAVIFNIEADVNGRVDRHQVIELIKSLRIEKEA